MLPAAVLAVSLPEETTGLAVGWAVVILWGTTATELVVGIVAAVLVVTADSSLADTAGWVSAAFGAWAGCCFSLATGAWLFVALSTAGVAGDSCLLQPAATRSAVPAANPKIECLYVVIMLN